MKENQRIRITKQCLRDSLIHLLQTKSIHSISVREICDGADINRTTFYNHYGSQYDLLKDMEDEALNKVDNYLRDVGNVNEDALARLHWIITYIQDNLDLFKILINNTVNTDFPQKLIRLPMIQQLLSQQLMDEYAQKELEYIYQFIVNGGFSMIRAWLNKDEREPPQDMARLLANVVGKLFV